MGILFLENTSLPDAYLARLQRYDAVLTGSAWLKALLQRKGLEAQKLGVFYQCVDYSVFYPRPEPPPENPRSTIRIFTGEAMALCSISSCTLPAPST